MSWTGQPASKTGCARRSLCRALQLHAPGPASHSLLLSLLPSFPVRRAFAPHLDWPGPRQRRSALPTPLLSSSAFRCSPCLHAAATSNETMKRHSTAQPSHAHGVKQPAAVLAGRNSATNRLSAAPRGLTLPPAAPPHWRSSRCRRCAPGSIRPAGVDRAGCRGQDGSGGPQHPSKRFHNRATAARTSLWLQRTPASVGRNTSASTLPEAPSSHRSHTRQLGRTSCSSPQPCRPRPAAARSRSRWPARLCGRRRRRARNARRPASPPAGMPPSGRGRVQRRVFPATAEKVRSRQAGRWELGRHHGGLV